MLDDNGFTRPSQSELVSNLTSKWLELFGSDSDTSEHSVAGVFIRLLAYFLNLLYQLAEVVYNSQFISTATGVSLERLASNYGLYRNPATQAIAELNFTGTPGFVIQAGALFKTADGLQFQLAANVILSSAGTGSEYAYAVDTGAQYNVAQDAIKYQVEPTSDIFTVGNKAVNNGADPETDKELANRIRIANDTRPSSPENGIISAVMAVPSVKTVQVVQNNTMEVDQYNNPPKTIHVYVDGGDETKVADALFNSVSAGVQTVGTIQKQMTDSAGFSGNIIAFDFAQKDTLFVNISATTNLNFETTGVQQIRDAVNSYLSTVPMGGIVRFSYLYKYIYDNVNGIDVATVTIGLSEAELAAKDVQLAQFAVAITSAESMVVTTNE